MTPAQFIAIQYGYVEKLRQTELRELRTMRLQTFYTAKMMGCKINDIESFMPLSDNGKESVLETELTDEQRLERVREITEGIII